MPTDSDQKKGRSFPVLVGAYLLVLLVACGVGYALIRTTVATADATAESKREKTVLDERIATAREIREILSRPQPPIEPLPPITAKRANPVPTKVVGMEGKKTIRLPKEARDAFAMEPPRYSSGPSWSAPSGSTRSYDRAGNGGW